MIKVLFQYAAGSRLRDQLVQYREQGLDIVSHPADAGPPDASLLNEVHAIWHVLEPITAEMLAATPNLRLIQKIGVGVNTIDLDAARSQGVRVCNMPGSNSQAVAEMTLLLMLSALRQQVRMAQACRSGKWSMAPEQLEGFGEIAGRVIGLVGFGEVPQRLAPVLEALGAEVIYTARTRKAVPWSYVSLDELLAQSDVVSLHLPLLPESSGLMNTRRIALMKPGAILVNTARGGLVDENALLNALNQGHLAAAALDVFAKEPITTDHPLLALDNVIVTPHLAWLTNETLRRSLTIASRNTIAAVEGRELEHLVC